MSFAFVQSRSTTATNALAFTSNTAAGSLLIAVLGEFSGTLATSVTDTQGNTYHFIGNDVGAGALSFYAAFSTAGGANTVTATGLTGSSGGPSIMIAEYSVPASFHVVGAKSIPLTNAAEISLSQISGTTNALIILGIYDKHTAHTWTGTGLTVRENPQESGGQCGGYGDAIVNGSSLSTVYELSGGGNGTGNSSLGLVLISAAAGAGGLAANPLGGFIR